MFKEQEIDRTNWLARAVLAGFCATVVMIVVFFYAYAIAVPLSKLHLNNVRGGMGSTAFLQAYLNNLIHNRVINYAHDSFYAALALHGVVGIIWAIVYAAWAEPKLPGPGWGRGMIFSILPWILSLVLFLPLVGGGMLGLGIGAGILPVVGNFILHLAYGAVLGAVYAPVSENLMEGETLKGSLAFERFAMRRAEGGAVVGLGLGLVGGLLLGVILLAVCKAAQLYTVLGLPDVWYLVATTMVVGCLGALVGSLVTLPTQAH